MTYRMGIDIGGTFTDFALLDDDTGRIAIHKQLTTPHDPSECVLEGMTTLLAQAGVGIDKLTAVVHGTTLITNAVIERKGAKTGVLVTDGFVDTLDIAMERRYDLYDLRLTFAESVVPRGARAGIAERVLFDGKVEKAVDLAQARAAVRRLVDEHRIEALAICFLHAYVNPAHENAVAEMVRREFPDLYVSASADVLPFMREYERWTTTTLNAYTQPMLDRYLARIENALERMGFAGSFLIMTSSSGAVTADLARRYPVRLLESGPAAGVVMTAFLGGLTGYENLLSYDMGGTTAKGALVRDGKPLKKFQLEAAREHEFKKGSGLPVQIPVIDMIEIGAGGGSLADVDEVGLLRVGPRSAGADPGPVCYGRGGTQPAQTDANVVLGYLDPEFFLGGKMKLDRPAAAAAIGKRVAEPLKLDTDRAAWGIHEVINEDVARAFRIHASELGFDYRQCSMVAFGGSGPIGALRVARKLKIPRVIFPAGAGVMSAIGMLVTPVSFESLRSERIALADLKPGALARLFGPAVAQARGFLENAGVAAADIRVIRRLDMRFVGQGYEVEVEVPEGDEADLLQRLPQLFRLAYEQVFAFGALDAPLEVVNWKVEAMGPRPKLAAEYKVFDPVEGRPKIKARRPIYFPEAGGFVDCPIYDRYALKPGDTLAGPALVEENESTCVIGVGDSVTVDVRCNLIAELAPETGA